MTKPFARPLLAAVLIGVIGGAPSTPTFGQQPQQPSQPQQQTPQNVPPKPPPATSPTPVPQGTVPISLGVSKHDYTHSPALFPNPLALFKLQYVEPGVLANSPRLEQLIRDGKMMLSLQDAIALAMENSMDIVVQRYNPWIADASVLKTRAGGFGYGVPGSIAVGSTANLPSFTYDPVFTQLISVANGISPVNNPLTSGTGTSTFLALPFHSNTYNSSYFQGFTTGTTANIFWDNSRTSSESTFNFFNPAVQSTIGVTLTQQLLAGRGRFVNRRNILIAENNRKISDLAFAQQAITTITNTINAYWELAYARENVKVQQQAVAVAEKLYTDNKKQLEIGTMAPLDVTRAESELASDRQSLIVAQTTQLQDEVVLKNFISKDPLASNLINVEIIPTDKPESPSVISTSSFEDAVKEAFAKRPELHEQELNVKNGEIDVRATKNALLPQATLQLQYSSSSLTGNRVINGPSTTVAGAPVVDAAGNPVTVLGPTGPLPIFVPSNTSSVAGVNKTGWTDAVSQVFHNQFPTYSAGINLQLPLHNRAAQADSVHAQLTLRQLEAQLQQLKNTALLDVRNTTIAVEQGRAQVEAASKARELQQQTFDAESKKYQLGASTVYNVILTQRDLINAQGAELRALANLAEAKANYERALGRTLEINNVTVAGAQKGIIERDTLIPGTVNGRVVGTEELLKALDTSSAAGQR